MGGSIDYIAEVFRESGAVGLVTAFVLFICFGIGLERLLFWGRLYGAGSVFSLLGLRSYAKRLGRAERLVASGRFAEAGQEAQACRQPALRLTGLALGRLLRPEAWRRTLELTLAETFGANLTLGRRFLITSIQGFGLLGMLGTCTGLYVQLSAFGQAAGGSGLQGAMSGMGQAFTTTLVGLGAAAVTTVIYFANEVALEHFERRLRYFSARIELALDGAGVNPAAGKAA